MPPRAKKVGTKVAQLKNAKSNAKPEDDEFIYEDVSQGYEEPHEEPEPVVDLTDKPKPRAKAVKVSADEKMMEILAKFKAQLDEEKKVEKAEREARRKELAEARKKEKEERDKALEGLILHGKRLTAKETESSVRNQVGKQLRDARLSGLMF